MRMTKSSCQMLLQNYQNLVQTTKEFRKNKNLMLNIEKTKVMDTVKGRNKTRIIVNDETIKSNNYLDYLGATFYDNGDSENERKRLAYIEKYNGNMIYKHQNQIT